MPRRREIPKRVILPDPKYSSQDVSKFINVLMTGGKKSVAERIIYGALDQIKKRSNKEPLEVFVQALAAHALLVRSGHDSRVEVGVSLDVCFRAHAWVVCSGAVVLGASEDQRYQRILVFD